MATELSKTQVDRLGDRLRKGNITEADLRLLDHYRRSFTDAYEVVVETEARAKSNKAILNLLRYAIEDVERLKGESDDISD